MSHEENIPQRLRDFLDDEDEWHNLSQHYSDYLNHTGRWSRSKSRSRSLSTKDKEWVRQAEKGEGPAWLAAWVPVQDEKRRLKAEAKAADEAKWAAIRAARAAARAAEEAAEAGAAS